jgi:hypothetical protein
MPPKSIAVPHTIRSPDRDRRAAAAVAAPVLEPLVETARPVARGVRQQPHHRYRVGERLRVGHGGNVIARAAAFCRVVALLPYEGHGALLYRVRSDTEQFERVVAEADLSRNAADP